MTQEYSRQIQYDLINGGSAPQRQPATVAYVEVLPLPTSNTLESMFRQAVSDSPDGILRNVLNDLLRHLVFSNYVHFRPTNDRAKNLALLNSQYPFAGQIVEAEEDRPTGSRRSGKTDACGAVLDLLLRAQNSREVNLHIGGILIVMLMNKTLVRQKPKPYFPMIHTPG
jgi:hypothetical protein